MKIVPFLISTGVALAALVLAIVSYSNGKSNLALQKNLQTKQQEIQELREYVEGKQREAQTQQQIIATGADVAQKYGPPILRDMGILAAKNKNENLKKLLVRQKLEAYIPTDEQLKQLEEAAKKQQQSGGNAPAPSTPAPATPR